MPIEYEMMHLKRLVDEGISKYTHDNDCVAWLTSAEDSVLDVLENDPNPQKYFRDYQLSAMRELMRRGYWVRHNEEYGHTMLYRLPPK